MWVRHFSPACTGGVMPDLVPELTWAHVISFLIVVCICQLTLIWLAHITLNYRQPADSPVVELVGVTNYISLYVGARRLVFHLSPRDCHVIIVSGFLILTTVNPIVLKPMGNINDKLHVLSSCPRSMVRFVRISKKRIRPSLRAGCKE